MRVIGYTLFALAGTAAIVWPAPSVAKATTGWLAFIWAGFLAGGGGASALGAVTDRWLGELLGLPLLVAAFSVYALAAASTGRAASAAGAMALAAIAAVLGARWLDVDWIRREATRSARRGG